MSEGVAHGGWDANRAVQAVAIDAAGKRWFGSGYLVSAELVLTAQHILRGTTSVIVRIFDAPGQVRDVLADAVFADARADVAVLRLRQPERHVAAVLFGYPVGPSSFDAVGFPRFKLNDDHRAARQHVPSGQGRRGRYRDSHHASGLCHPDANRYAGTLELTLAAPGPDPDGGRSPWEGMSGAAVFAEDCLIAVVNEHHVREGLSRLTASRVQRWYELLDPARISTLCSLIGLPEAVDQLTPVGLQLTLGGAVGNPFRARAQRPVRLGLRPANLVGRESLLARISAQLKSSAPVPRLVVLHGLGGIGKTSLAVEYAYRHLADYALAWRLPAENGVVLSNACAELAVLLGVRERGDTGDPVSQLHATLASRTDPWLMLLDNVRDAEAVADVIPPAGPGHILITSRSAHWPGEFEIEVPLLEQSVAAAFLLDGTNPDGADQDQARTATVVAAELGALPLALEQARAYTRETGRTLREYRILLNERRTALLDRGQPWGYSSRVASTWDVAFEELRASAPEAVALLQLLSCWAPEAIPLDLLLGTSQSAMVRVADPEVATQIEPLNLDALALDDARRALGRYSLARNERGSLVTVHRLVQAVAIDRLAEPVRRAWQDAAAGLVEAALPAAFDDPATWSAFGLLMPHAMAVLDPSMPGFARVIDYLNAISDYPTARDLQAQVVATGAERLGEEAPEVLEARARLAKWTGLAGNPIAARDLLDELHRTTSRVLGPENRLTLTLRAWTADWTGQAGNWPLARDLSARALPALRRVLGDDAPETVELWHILGFWTGQNGYPEAARAIYEEFMPIQQRLLGPWHRDVLSARDQYARYVANSGDLTRAIPLVESVLGDYERIMGAQHSHTLWARGHLAWLTAEAGDFPHALSLYQELVRDRLRIFGPKHPATQVEQGNFAYWTGISGDAVRARDQFEALLPIRQEVLGPEHPETLLVMENIAEWTGQAGDPCRARDLFTALLPVYVRVQGSSHPWTVKAVASLNRWSAVCSQH
jgi:hypothetical protein